MAVTKPFLLSLRYASTIGDGTGTGATFAIAATAFTDDTGAAVTAFPATYAFYNLYVNGVIQQGDASTLSTTAITIPDGNLLNPGNPVTVEIVVN
ncbi:MULTISPECIES: DUF4183 domain-containing protein [unclassified Paenibacillus]|uniref:DUF4183 domain-containing protein n=1 Tax=unclassified Paenibacillus TaxID=185978 RepID=UPI001C123BF9|nr:MULTISPECIES: DUF4183 domain-containing protein [unclassified Paenibacillus]MBU5443424.1 DUF4183 domain-containing protein [Paenibacillus sp. MSJ-34]CAH0122447.1 hypothetical protein PAE9249_04998 [Paenibacillus sp. CECT 9249]